MRDSILAAEPTQKLRFYQKGTFTLGNRLVSEAERSVQASIDRSNALTCGHRACQGCGDAGDRPQSDRGQRHGLSRSVHYALPRDVVAGRLAAFPVRQCAAVATG